MPRFFFHVRDDVDCPDHEGSELPDLKLARDQAVREARLLMCELLRAEGRIALHHRIDIEGADDTVLASVSFRDAVTIEDSGE